MLCRNKECHRNLGKRTDLGTGTIISAGKMPDGRTWTTYQASCPYCQTVTTKKYIEKKGRNQ